MNSLNPIWRDRLYAGAGILVAITVGYFVAMGSKVVPGLVLLGVSLLVYNRASKLPLEMFVVASLFAGYFIGNRGFAQFMVVPSFPLLPGEAALALILAIQVIHRVLNRESHRALTAADWTIGLFILIGCIRFVFDFRGNLFLAIRDFATVYYAVFFFLASNLVSRRPDALKTVLATIRVSSLIMVPLFLLSQRFPDIFMGPLSFRGVPLIFFKDDLVGAYCAIGAVAYFMHSETTGSRLSLALSIVLAGCIVLTNNRAAMLGLAVATGWICLGKRWRFPLWLGLGGLFACVVILFSAQLRNQSWQDTPLLEFYERVVSVFDPSGQGSYQGALTESKGDNNLFRTVWWSVVYRETIDTNPLFGLGFGHDIAASFLREYYANAPDDFSARSPHSIIVTIFARMGFVGGIAFLSVIGVFFIRTWRFRFGDPDVFTAACSAWVIFASACFGVVLEGPMGAIPFWILLGLTHGASASPAAETTTETSLTPTAGTS